MKAIGEIEIKEGLILNSPSMSINSVLYDWNNNIVSVECLFSEDSGLYKHSITYRFSATTELTSSDVLDLIKTVEELKVFE